MFVFLTNLTEFLKNGVKLIKNLHSDGDLPIRYKIAQTKMKNLTIKQQKFYDFVWNKNNWRPPTWATIRRYLGVSGNQTIVGYIKFIEKKGYKLPLKHYTEGGENYVSKKTQITM
ncbi:MAG: hypothetical protein ABIJ43_05850 [Candidatus Beckwithbacteria bacterium]